MKKIRMFWMYLQMFVYNSLGMPLIRKIDKDLWEVRTRLTDEIARVFFSVDGKYMILLHGFIEKSQKTPQNELKTALSRLGTYNRGSK